MDTRLIMTAHSNDPDFEHGKDLYAVVFLDMYRVVDLLNMMKLCRILANDNDKLISMKYSNEWSHYFGEFPYPEAKEFMIYSKLFVQNGSYRNDCLPTHFSYMVVYSDRVQWIGHLTETNVKVYSVSVTEEELNYHLSDMNAGYFKSTPAQKIKSIILPELPGGQNAKF